MHSSSGPSSSQTAVTEIDLYVQELKEGTALKNRQLFLVRKTLSKRQERMTANMDLPKLEMYVKEFPHYMDSEMVSTKQPNII